jgi:hypothetical protein
MKHVYLASPYSHIDPAVREYRAVQARRAIMEIAQHGVPIYSPIAHWHQVAVDHKLPTDATFWLVQNDPMVYQASEVWVLVIDGWQQSKGLEHEVEQAKRLGLRVRHVEFVSIPETCSHWKCKYENVSGKPFKGVVEGEVADEA